MKFFAVLVLALCVLNVLAAPKNEKRLPGLLGSGPAPAVPANTSPQLFGGATVNVGIPAAGTLGGGTPSASSGTLGGGSTTGATNTGAVPNLLQNLLNGIGQLLNSLLKTLGLNSSGSLANTLTNTGLTNPSG